MDTEAEIDSEMLELVRVEAVRERVEAERWFTNNVLFLAMGVHDVGTLDMEFMG